MIWLLVGYMWLFVHRPFEFWPWLGALHVERVYMLFTIAYWAFCAEKTWTRNRVTWGIGGLAAAVVLATLYSPYTDLGNPAVEGWFKVLVFYFLVLSSVGDERGLRTLIVAFVAITGIYELHCFREYLCGRGGFAMGIWRMIGVDTSLGDANSFAASVNYGIPMLLPVLALARKRWHYLVIAAAAALACLCILLTGSRTGFACLVLLAGGVALASKYRIRLTVLTLAAAPLIWFSLSDRLEKRYETLIDPSVGPANAQESAESRKVFFRIAVDIWKQHPVLGVGPGCFLVVSGVGLQSHTLYAQTISELGTVGIAALLLLVGAYAANYFEARRVFREMSRDPGGLFCYRVVQATAIALLQLLFCGLGGHNLFRYHWLWFAAFSAIALRCLKARQANVAWDNSGGRAGADHPAGGSPQRFPSNCNV